MTTISVDSSATGTFTGSDGVDEVDASDGLGTAVFVAFEKLAFGWTGDFTASISQLNSFSSIELRNPSFSNKIVLAGDGGVLDFSTRLSSAVLLDVDGSNLTSTSTITGTSQSDHFSGFHNDDAVSGGMGDDTLVLKNDQVGSGTFDGGDGSDEVTGDTVVLGTLLTTGVETVSANALSATIAQVRSFGTVTVAHTLRLVGEGGALDLSTLASNPAVDASDATSKVTLTSSASGSSLTGSDFGDALNGSSAKDRLRGGKGGDTLSAGNGNDFLLGAAGNDVLNGGKGDDRLNGGAGNDKVNGQEGNDTIVLFSKGVGTPAGTAIVDGGAGDDLVTGNDLGDTTFRNVETLFAAGKAVTGSIAQLSSFSRFIAVASFNLTGEGGTFDLTKVDTAPASDVDASKATSKVILAGTGAINVFIGTKYDDSLNGGDGRDVLTGGAGADRLDGSHGIDTATYAGAAKGVVVSLAAPGENTGDAKGDVLVSIEKLVGSSHADSLSGTAKADDFSGGDGNDRLSGEAGNDLLNGGAGADRLIGGAAIDTASYAGAAAGVHVSLVSPDTNTNDAAGDTYLSIENVTGSSSNDNITGDAAANKLDGGAGWDVLNGGAGADRLIGGDGIDTASYVGASEGVRVDLSAPGSNTNDAKGDSYSSIEDIRGSAHDDILIGSAEGDVLEGKGGHDIIKGGDGDDQIYGNRGVDILYGGRGEDIFWFATVFDMPTSTTAIDTIADFSQSERDVIGFLQIDADRNLDGHQSFNFIGTSAFSKTAGELRFETTLSDTYIYGDTDGDGKADFALHLGTAAELTAADFILDAGPVADLTAADFG
jgi:Ca2+-binding RTX toxin-like protein